METADYVLKDFSSTDKKSLPVTLELAADAVGSIVANGLAAAQQEFHSA
jgi:PTH1 family peptidyl-tRNA hydrolase